MTVSRAHIRDFKAAVQAEKKIEMIKIWRLAFGTGLKEAKDAIDVHYTGNNALDLLTLDKDGVVKSFYEMAGFMETITKEQFIATLTAAVNTSDALHMDMLDVIELFVKNIKNKGGLPYLAKYYERFMDAI
jgi:hypothetical protein